MEGLEQAAKGVLTMLLEEASRAASPASMELLFEEPPVSHCRQLLRATPRNLARRTSVAPFEPGFSYLSHRAWTRTLCLISLICLQDLLLPLPLLPLPHPRPRPRPRPQLAI